VYSSSWNLLHSCGATSAIWKYAA